MTDERDIDIFDEQETKKYNKALHRLRQNPLSNDALKVNDIKSSTIDKTAKKLSPLIEKL